MNKLNTSGTLQKWQWISSFRVSGAVGDRGYRPQKGLSTDSGHLSHYINLQQVTLKRHKGDKATIEIALCTNNVTEMIAIASYNHNQQKSPAGAHT